MTRIPTPGAAPAPVPGPLRRFLRGEGGAVTVDWVVLTSGLVGLGLAAITLVSGGVEDLSRDTSDALTGRDIVFESANFGADRAAIIAGMDWTSYTSGTHAMNHFNNLVANLTDAELRNRHRNWVNAANNPDHANHAQAAERVVVFEMAMAERGVTPHAGY